MPRRARLTLLIVAGLVLAAAVVIGVRQRRSAIPTPPSGWEAIDHVADGDTVVVRGGITVRLVQIDTPEVFYTAECFGEEASTETKELLPRGTLVRLVRDPATDDKDQYGRLLRYVVRRDGLNINLRLVADGAAAPYFFDGVQGAYGALLSRDAAEAEAEHRGLWGACPGTRLEPDHGVSTGPP